MLARVCWWAFSHRLTVDMTVLPVESMRLPCFLSSTALPCACEDVQWMTKIDAEPTGFAGTSRKCMCYDMMRRSEINAKNPYILCESHHRTIANIALTIRRRIHRGPLTNRATSRRFNNTR